MQVLQTEQLVTAKPAYVMRAGDGAIVEVFEWRSAEAIHQAHSNPAVQALWGEFGANIDAKGVFGATALHWAAINGHAGTVELLISHGANLTLKDTRFEATAEGWAEEGAHPQIADTLRRSRRTA